MQYSDIRNRGRLSSIVLRISRGFQQVLSRAVSDARNKPGKLYDVWGNTRSGWAIYTIKNLLKTGDFAAIQFLTDSGHEYKFENEHGCTSVAYPTRSSS